MTETGRAPAQFRIEVPVQPVATATSTTVILGECVDTGQVIAAEFIPNANINGVNTNTRRHRVVNRALDGTGTTVVAELQYNAGTNATGGDKRALTLQAPANLEVDAGHVLALESAAIGTGLADPGGVVVVTYERE